MQDDKPSALFSSYPFASYVLPIQSFRMLVPAAGRLRPAIIFSGSNK
jgi:hypothetical protein